MNLEGDHKTKTRVAKHLRALAAQLAEEARNLGTMADRRTNMPRPHEIYAEAGSPGVTPEATTAKRS